VGRTDVAGQAQAGGSGVNGNTSGMTDVDMVNPIEGGKIRGTDSWGEGAYNSIRTSTGRHGAVDITAPPGTPVRAPYAGGIENIGSEMNVGVGLGGKIGEDVYYSRLLHIDSIVTNGQLVGKGQIIGYIQDITTFYDINMTNHVHWELYLSVGGMDRNIDPTKYIK
jgi:murein DD-endopeptidase MepM/ murein hydrolase activator NlpD